jgi:hypothetical protein
MINDRAEEMDPDESRLWINEANSWKLVQELLLYIFLM